MIKNKSQPKTWRKVKLEEVSTLITKGTTPTTIGGDFVSKGINFIKAESITDDGRFIKEKLGHIDEKTNQLLKRSVILESDILYSIAGVIGRSALVTKEVMPANTNQALAIIRLDKNQADPKYIFYVLSTTKQRNLANSFVAQSVQANINLKQVGDFEISLPEITEQKRIAEILSAFDDKIELNNKIGRTLEEMASAIFKEWFLKFKFPGHGKSKFVDSELGKIPKGWKIGKIKDVVDVISGYPFSSRLYSPKDGLGVVTIKNVQDGQFITEFNSFIKKENIPTNLNSTYYLKSGDIILSLTGNVGRVCFVYGGEYLLNQRVAKLVPKRPNDFAYCYFLFRQGIMQNYMINMAKGSAQPNLSPVEMSNTSLVIPPSETLDDFSKIAAPIYERILNNSNQYMFLTSLRDLLLPKLMSGEIRI